MIFFSLFHFSFLMLVCGIWVKWFRVVWVDLRIGSRTRWHAGTQAVLDAQTYTTFPIRRETHYLFFLLFHSFWKNYLGFGYENFIRNTNRSQVTVEETSASMNDSWFWEMLNALSFRFILPLYASFRCPTRK